MVSKANPVSNPMSDARFHLKPLTAAVRIVVAGSVLVAPLAQADSAVLPVPDANFVTQGMATQQIVGDTLHIEQQTDRAILNWQSFNVGQDNTVRFQQPGSTSVALNRIGQADPSRILGQIVANGQVYLYNRNGFIFGKDAVVDTNSFLASTLHITDEAFTRGITRVFDETGKPALGIDGVLDNATTQILVEAGAKISVDKAGRIILAAPTIENRGKLTAGEQGQIILAASKDKVYLQPADDKSPFAGLVVEVETGGKVTNAETGDIGVRQGNITLAGFAVNQQGRINATTSVNVNGSIRLVAQEGQGRDGNKLIATRTTRTTDQNDGLGTQSSVTFASGSTTEVVADEQGGSAIDEQRQPKSHIGVVGHTVSMAGGSRIFAPSGDVRLTATNSPQTPLQGQSGRIHIDNGATIDVSGYDNVPVAMSRNVGEVSVQSFELRDSPVQKDGPLRGQTVHVDLRKGSTIVDSSGAVARISRGIQERLGSGGDIQLTASGDVVINSGARLDISGGSVAYAAGFINTTKLATADGRIFDITNADPDLRYQSIVSTRNVEQVHGKWGETREWSIAEQFAAAQFEPGYSKSLDAGSLTINTPALRMNGQLLAAASQGIYQRQLADRALGGRFIFDSTAFATAPQNIRFQAAAAVADLALAQAFPQTDGRPQDLILSNSLINAAGVQQIALRTLGKVTVAADGNIQLVPGAVFQAQAGTIDVLGTVRATAGNIELATVADRGILGGITLHNGSLLDTSGGWVNDFRFRGTGVLPNDPLAIDGGTVSVRSVGDLVMQQGARIRADGGGWLDQSGGLTPGNGGSIALIADGGVVASRLRLNGAVSAAALGQGGRLTLGSADIVVGNGATSVVNPLRLTVSNGRFDFDPQGGFGEINLLATLGDVVVTHGTVLDMKTANLLLNGDFLNRASGADIRGFSRLVVLPEHLRQANALTLTANKSVMVETGAVLAVDKAGSLDLTARLGGVYLDGTLNAPGGNITLAIKAVPQAEYDARQTVRLGENARILARGDIRLNLPDVFGRRTGQVLDGGRVLFDLERGSAIFQRGSLIDVSGTHTVFDLPRLGAGAAITAPTQVFGNAGQINVTVAEAAVFEGRMIGLVSSEGARGGRFSFSFDRDRRSPPSEPLTPFPHNPLLVRLREQQIPSFDNRLAFGAALPDAMIGQATLSAEMLEGGGFEDVRIRTPDSIQFQGNVGLSAKARIDLDANQFSWTALGGEAATVSLDARLIRLGSSLRRDVTGTPTSGNAAFNANAQWMELTGGSRWDGFNRINLSSAHDLRTVGLRTGAQRDFTGTLVTAANINLTASQIYPSTLSQFTFAIRNNPNGSIRILPSGQSSQAPLSAAGRLVLEAPVIEHNGALRAPLGEIHLKAAQRLILGNGSLTSVSGEGNIVPFGVLQAGLDWLYPLDGIRNLVFNTLPEKKLVLEAPDIDMQQGSVVNLAGGGDLSAHEFIPGHGGSFDYLNPNSPAYQGGFAIVPTLNSRLAPFDHFQNNFVGWQRDIGNTVFLTGSASKGLAAGEYTILPAYYALLPGAFLITPMQGSQDQSITTLTSQGLPVVAGQLRNAVDGSRDARWSGFRIENGADVRMRSNYTEQRASTFFPALAARTETAVPLLPADAGQISLIAQNRLVLDSRFLVDAQSGGRGARMDIAAERIRVVSAPSATVPAGVLEIAADDLSALAVDSLLLGGARQRDVQTGATRLSVNASNVTFASGVDVSAKDLLAAARDQITVETGAKLSASGAINTGDSVYTVAGDGALLRLSGDRQVALQRAAASGTTGSLNIAAGATLSASQSMLLDASRATVLLGDIVMRQGSLNLSGNTINLGEVGHLGGTAMNLSNSKLMNLTVDELILSARDSIGIYGNLGQVDANNAPVLDVNGQQQAITFKRLVLDSAGLVGQGNANQHARIHADTLRLLNSRGVNASHTASGRGEVSLSGDDVQFGGGALALTGFDQVNINAGRQWRFEGDNRLTLGGDLAVQTPVVTAGGGARLTLNAADHDVSFATMHPTVPGSISSGFAARLAVTANTIDFDTRLALPSGNAEFNAQTGDVTLGEHARVDLAGRAVRFADIQDFTPGGRLNLTAGQGNVVAARGAEVNLNSGGGSAAGGVLSISAPTKSVDFNDAVLSARRGSVNLDIHDFSGGDSFDGLMQQFINAGIDQGIQVRVRNADIVQAADGLIRAADIQLASDRGAITLAGRLNADGQATGGRIALHAGDAITLNGAQLTAKGGTKGGTVLLSSTDTDADGISGIALNGAVIDVAGATVAQGGEVTFRALLDDNGVLPVQIDPNSRVQGYHQQATVRDADGNLVEYGDSQFQIEAVRRYVDGDGRLTENDFNTYLAHTNDYMTAANMQAVENSLGARLRPGVEVVFNGNLTVAERWDMVEWRYGDGTDRVAMPGTLTLRASGNLLFNRSLSDGFKDGVVSSVFGDMRFSDMLQGGESWSYRLVAGADLAAADWAATASSGNLTLGSNVQIRTGTGDMALVAAGDVVLTDQTSVIYSAGRPTTQNPYGALQLHMAIGSLPLADYPIDGGDLSIRAGGNILGAQSNQFINAWMVRQGGKDPDSRDYLAVDAYLETVAADLLVRKDDAAELAAYIASLPAHLQTRIVDGYKLDARAFNFPTTWGFSMGNGGFQQNVGSFGGGNVNIAAAGNINNLTVVMPTSGKQVGQLTSDVNYIQTLSLLTNQLEVMPSGNLALRAGGDVQGGVFYVGEGQGRIEAAGSITGSGALAGPHLLMGNSRMSLLAGRDVNIGAVSDPMILHSGDTNFFSYGDASHIDARALAGNVRLAADISRFTTTLSAQNTAQNTLARVYPAGLNATAFGGSVILADDIVLFPAPRADLNMLAAQDFRSEAAAKRLAMSDADRSLLPSALIPVAGNEMDDPVSRINPFGHPLFARAAVPTRINDSVPVRIVASAGNIDNVQLNLAKQAVFKTGQDLRNSLLLIQHNNLGDSTVFDMGRDLRFSSVRDLNGQLIPNINEINIAGPGNLLIKTGRHLDLGASVGISTTGDLNNPGLPDSGASVSTLVGLNGRQPAYAGFIEAYLGGDTRYSDMAAQVRSLITGFMRDRSGNPVLSDEDAFAAFKQLASDDYLTLQPRLNALVVQVYVDEIKRSGSAAAGSGALANEGGYRAIETLFPTKDIHGKDIAAAQSWRGDLSLFFSKIHTLDDGSINLLVPGGFVNAGLAVGTDAKPASQLGIVAQRQGDINAVIRDDFMVNQSRVFALDSGDILVWSSEGNIDAGRGAKSAIAAPPPKISFDENGNMVIEFPPIVSGSGIRTAGQIGRTPGDVFLFAPRGVVDAGEAGIAGTNVTIAAVAVLGAANIQVGGTATGVPVAPTGSLAAGLTGAGNVAAGVTQMAESSVSSDVGKDAANTLSKAMMGILSVEVIGFGE
ncbi:MAG: filamentous hemagglutinin family protein [Methylomonas sp.]|nr:filamentous hemagglutinin family protein [Methylomonas sp.]PPD21145.1 MAG: hypothetical protein CTY23_06555 [Methylomonas sp.]PPD27579.1 MAG: hypothetical protein CTY22_01585 [Methylomonas sp.]PPD39575.1 MAG: hypothetical protein CTY21_01580 [Methylomonas sp.]PPD55826.1 MAG: hypothetical protein CTY11_00850 [Methylomonas sp.]